MSEPEVTTTAESPPPPVICRACHYGHHNECEDDRCACR